MTFADLSWMVIKDNRKPASSMKIKRDTLISRRKLSPAEKRMAQRDRNVRYTAHQMLSGIPDRRIVAEAILQSVLLSGWRGWNDGKFDKSDPAYQYSKKLLNDAKKRLLKLNGVDRKPLFTKRGVKHRLDVVLSDLIDSPRPAFKSAESEEEEISSDASR